MAMFQTKDINAWLQEMKAVPGAVLLDVREPDEYREARIPGSVNIPLSEIGKAAQQFDPDTPIFVHCLSGGRSMQAARALQMAGFQNVTNIGGINRYRGEIEKG